MNLKIEFTALPEKKIARMINDHLESVDPCGKGPLVSIGREFENRITVRDVKIVRTINDHAKTLIPVAKVLFFPSGVNLKMDFWP